MIKNQNKELLKETIDRINQYEKHAIDGIFIPGLKNKEFISTIARNISVPLNIMLDIQSDKLEEYLSIGISRISFGPSTFLEFNHTNFTVEDYFKQKIDQISYLENNKLINLARG
ncbi:isocitrate lyase/phosphoenolpyruvate mutase family protein [Leuconostoc gelidum]|nr:isocitrate lyase/phosphoenolpyruvate mutase family protein [Leuconostoc gelidum]